MALIPTVAQAAQLVASPRSWMFRFERISVDGQVIAAEDVVSCSIANNDLATDVKRTCQVQLPASTTFDYLQHSLRVYARLVYDLAAMALSDSAGNYEWCLGTFYLATPENLPDSPAVPISTDGFDWGLKAVQAKSASRTTTTDLAATTYGAALAALLTSAGYTSFNINGDAYLKNLPSVMEWEPGASVLEMVNDLLAGLNFRSLYVDEFGVPVCEPYIDPLSGTASWSYVRDANSVTILGSTVVTLDVFDTPNQWVGSYSAPDAAPLLYVKTNAEPSSKYSTVSRGRTITRILESDVVGSPPDLATLTATVERIAAEASQAVEEVSFSTGLMPFHGTGDLIDLDPGTGVSVRYREHTWDMDLNVGGEMKHVVRRAVTL